MRAASGGVRCAIDAAFSRECLDFAAPRAVRTQRSGAGLAACTRDAVGDTSGLAEC